MTTGATPNSESYADARRVGRQEIQRYLDMSKSRLINALDDDILAKGPSGIAGFDGVGRGIQSAVAALESCGAPVPVLLAQQADLVRKNALRAAREGRELGEG